jgi:uncharacterized protein
MRLDGPNLDLSATDLANFLGCHHRTALEMDVAAGLRKRPHFDDPLLELLFKRGDEHEKAHVDSLRSAGSDVLDLNQIKDRDEHVAATIAAMRAGTGVIVQGALSHNEWFGKPDILQRVGKSSALGNWSYEIADTKLARETRAGAILQLGLYSEMLSVAQGLSPEYFHVVTPDPDQPVHRFRVDDYAAYFRLVRDQLAATVLRAAADIAAEYYPEPVEHCQICPWSSGCNKKRHADDHLSLVAGITRVQRRELETRGTRTLTDLGRLSLPIPFKPDRGSADSYVRVREQARLQVDSRGKTPPLHELREIIEGEGLCRLPPPSAGDIFLDLEGDNFAVEGGREYLFGLVVIGDNGAPVYHSQWGFNDRDERAGFEAVMDRIAAAIAQYPDMHVYHYAPYEQTAFKRLMGRYATRENELDAMLRGGRFVDLYAVVRHGLRAGIERYSIKNLEPLYAFTREVSLIDANRALPAFAYALALGATDLLPPEVRATVEGYNKDDSVSTLRLRDWLEARRAEVVASGKPVPRPTNKEEAPSEAVGERTRRVEELRRRLFGGATEAGAPPIGTPDYGRWLIAYLLDYHRRSDKAEWWEYFRLRDLPEDDLFDEPKAVAGLKFVTRVGEKLNAKTRKPTGTVTDRYEYPSQEMEINRGAEVKRKDGKKFGEVVRVDREARTIDIEVGPSQRDNPPTSVFAHTNVSPRVMEDSLFAIAEAIANAADCAGAGALAEDFLLGRRPSLKKGVFAQPPDIDGSVFAVDVVPKLADTVLAIQGPPGTGKTYTGARMICALVAVGKKVGVTAHSHQVIANLLREVADAAKKTKTKVKLAHKAEAEDADHMDPAVTLFGKNEDALHALQSGEANVVGGTAWLWARADMAKSVDVLVVDEAGQVSLANALAVSPAATSMVLLGDPQQLEQPQKGSHPDGVSVSALEQMLKGHKTIPPQQGIFLRETWRLAPAISRFTSELFYESRLESRPTLEKQSIGGVAGIEGSGLWYVEVEHDGRTSASDEEAAVVADLVARLTAPGATWTSAAGVTTQLIGADILVVSPFNAQVSRLADNLRGTGVRVGTVDKFQGQEASVVIYSMATSRPEDAPRGMAFLYSLNRLNVATSRAKCAVIVVANPRLFQPECRSPEQMKLANALCRYRELSRTPRT